MAVIAMTRLLLKMLIGRVESAYGAPEYAEQKQHATCGRT
ncbi:hypothetical protein EDE08_117101 [Bradyrhizobium sp. R2.2-H]|jgi:hypothetical protein|nr:hypothetical protein EDE10_11745 [Bradyrhizobium sp. Y-H1]TCU65918.1 hypothetical protein EDE08_117101 [Bradyrhizobium sp. R2.2-H]